MTVVLGALAVLSAAFVKGAVAFGFPTVATPLLALLIDVKTAVAILVPPNLVMDIIQAVRRPGLVATLRRHAWLYVFGIAGTFYGTELLKRFSDRQAMLALGIFILIFVVLSGTRVSFRVSPRWETVVSIPMGFLAGVVGGVTNTPGTPLVLYFYALGLDKTEFVRSIALAFILYKAAQLIAVIRAGFMTAALVGVSAAAIVVALGGFVLGLSVQDRMNQRTFNRVVLGVLAALGAFLLIRATR